MKRTSPAHRPLLLLATPSLCLALAMDACRSFESHDPQSTGGDAGSSGYAANGGDSSSEQSIGGGDSASDHSAGGGARPDDPTTNGGVGEGHPLSSAGNGEPGGGAAQGGSEENPREVFDDTLGGEETFLPPACNLAVSWLVGVKNVSSLAMSMTPYNSPNAQLYTTDPDVSVIAVRWSGYNGKPDTWDGWGCFDALPKPERIAAVSLADFQVHIFTITAAGSLYIRRSFGAPVQWSGWFPMGRPTRYSDLTDVAVSGAHDTHLFVIDGETLFYRYLIDPNPDSTVYSAWARMAIPTDAVHVASVRRLDGKQQVFIVDSAEEVWTATALSSVPGSGFTAWEDLGSGCAVSRDLDASVNETGQLSVHCLDVDSSVHSRRTAADAGGGAGGAAAAAAAEPGDWEDWTSLGAPKPYTLNAVAAYTSGDASIRIAAVAPDGTTFVSDGTANWQPLKLRP